MATMKIKDSSWLPLEKEKRLSFLKNRKDMAKAITLSFN